MTKQGEHILRVKDFARHPYAWPGGYPMFAITSDGAALCVACVKKEMRNIVTAIAQGMLNGWKVVAIDINWEDSNLYCHHCSERIESAYSED